MADRQRIGRAILDSAADAVVAADRDGRIAFWNVGAERIFGRTAREMAGEASLERPDNLEALIRADYERARPGDTLEVLKRRARFSKQDKALLRDWLVVARRRAAARTAEPGEAA